MPKSPLFDAIFVMFSCFHQLTTSVVHEVTISGVRKGWGESPRPDDD